MCPPTFVTFVLDNNDVNPESIFGETMHCTNDTTIQICSGITQQPNRPCQPGRKKQGIALFHQENVRWQII